MFSTMIWFLFFHEDLKAHFNQQATAVSELIRKGDFQKSSELLKQIKAEGKNESEIYDYLSIWNTFASGKFEETLSLSQEVLKKEPTLKEEIISLRAQAYLKLGKTAEALEEDQKILKMNPSAQLRFDVSLRSIRALEEAKRYKEAARTLAELERKWRSTVQYATVLFELARVEKKLNKNLQFCRNILKLYSKYPTFAEVLHWSHDLKKNEFEGAPTGCSSQISDFKERTRALLWGGEDEKARSENIQVITQLAEHREEDAQEHKAWFLLLEGQPEEALKILQPLYEKKKKSISFLQSYASAAARSGQAIAAVEAYEQMYKLAGKGSQARRYLYQAAFLSYQYRDYAGAAQRFQEFIKKYPKSGLAKDSRWHLAWITYLQGQHKEAFASFKKIAREEKGVSKERALYWAGMSALRLDEKDRARVYFKNLSIRTSGSFYEHAAMQRLKTIPETKKEKEIYDSEFPQQLAGQLSRWEVLLPVDGYSGDDDEGLYENEETLAQQQESEQGEDEPVVSPENEVQGLAEIYEKLALPPGRFQTAMLKAKQLLAMGFVEEAKWQLFEIERRTQNHDLLKTLIAVYEENEQYHRSSSIAEIQFGQIRSQQGYQNAKKLWQNAFPEAFKSQVLEASKKNKVPAAFIWGIMRAESRYRKDAVSPVGALGLMQVMPATGRRIASLQKESEYNPHQLLTPQRAIDQGAFYLSRLSQKFEKVLPLAAAAYNAGPHRVHSWLINFGHLDIDEFIEHIPFLETRIYVKKVVTNSLIYHRLYDHQVFDLPLTRAVGVKGQVDQMQKEIWD